MKFLILLLISINTSTFASEPTAEDFKEICVKGVVYYVYQHTGWTQRGWGYMAVKIDKDTLKPVSCSK